MRRIVWVAFLLPLSGTAHAEIKDWQLRRLLDFRTDCQMDDVVDRSGPTGPGRFHATCRNITFYPDGVDVECPDRTDEWSCRILTEAVKFKEIDRLHQSDDK